jgi:hypothetical protein
MYPRLHKLGSQPGGNCEQKRGETLHSETDIDQEIAAAAGNKRRSSWRKEDSDLQVKSSAENNGL